MNNQNNSLLDAIMRPIENETEFNSMNELEELLKKPVALAKVSNKIDMTDYSVPDGSKYVIMDTKLLNTILEQLFIIIDLSSAKAVSRGISIKAVDKLTIDIICPNNTYYFKTTISAENNLDLDKVIFIEYSFLAKIKKFMPPKILIYSKENTTMKNYIRLINKDIEIINANLIKSDIKNLSLDYALINKPVSTLNPEETLNKLKSMYKIARHASATGEGFFNSFNGILSFSTSFFSTVTQLELPNIKLDLKTIKYLIKACEICGTNKQIMIFPTTSEAISRYAIVYDNTIMVTNFQSVEENKYVSKIMSNMITSTVIDYKQSQYQLEFINSIIYALPTITLENKNNLLTSNFKLANGEEYKLVIKTLNEITNLPDKISLNSKTFFLMIDALNPNLETKIGYNKGSLFLTNSEVSTAITILQICK